MFSTAHAVDDSSTSMLYSELPMNLALFSCGVLGWAVTRCANQRLLVPRNPPAGKLAELDLLAEEKQAASLVKSKRASPPSSSKASRRRSKDAKVVKAIPVAEHDDDTRSQEEPASEPACQEEVNVTPEPSPLDEEPAAGTLEDEPAKANSERVAKLLAKKAERKARKAQEAAAAAAAPVAAPAAPPAVRAEEASAAPVAPTAQAAAMKATNLAATKPSWREVAAAQLANTEAAAVAPMEEATTPEPAQAPVARTFRERPTRVIASPTLWADVVATPKKEGELTQATSPVEAEPEEQPSEEWCEEDEAASHEVAVNDEWDSWSANGGQRWSGGQRWQDNTAQSQDDWMKPLDQQHSECGNMYGSAAPEMPVIPLMGEDGSSFYTDGEQVYMMACVAVPTSPVADCNLGYDQYNTGNVQPQADQDDCWDQFWGLS